MEQAFIPAVYVLLLALMALTAWWAFRSYHRQCWVRFSVAVALLMAFGFGWNAFVVGFYLLGALLFGWSFS